MVRIATAAPAPRGPRWQKIFLAMLPKIVRYAKIAFRHYRPEAKEEAIQNVVTNSCAAVAALARRGKLDVCFPSVLAQFGIRQTLDHRLTGGSLNVKDVLSKYCQDRKRVTVERLDQFDEDEDQWQEAVVEDTRTASVPEIVGFRLDFADWLKSLNRRDRRMAEYLSLGNRTQDAARKFRVSEGRVSQLRRELAESWRAFTDDNGGSTAA